MLRCIKGLEVQPLKCGAGYYVGTLEDGEPKCRLTSEYACNPEEAKKLVLDRQGTTENAFCNGCGYCGIEEVQS